MSQTKSKTFARDATGLVREYSWRDVFFISTGNLGVGLALVELFNWTPYQYPESNLPLMMFFGLIVCIFVGCSFVLFSVAMPRSGGDYIFTSRTLGPRWGFMANFTLYTQNWGFVAVDTTLFTSVVIAGSLFAAGLSTGNQGLMDLATSVSTPQ